MRIVIAIGLLLFSLPIFAAPKSELWSYWQPHDPTNTNKISHQDWQQLLNKYLVIQPNQTLFRYNQVSSADKQKLATYIKRLSAQNPHRYNRDVQFAYWVNLYNALTVQLIIDNYPVKSITKLGGLFSFGPWDQTIITINNKKLTLNDIEHRILRPIWQDPRIHYAVNCASLGCPDLLPEAFNSDRLDSQLDQAATRFINSEKAVKVTKNGITLSSIYDWYQTDFGSLTELQQHLNHYRVTPNVQLTQIRYTYNWQLNQKL